MKTGLWILLGSLLATGCATSTIQRRKQERLAVYQGLSSEQRLAVDHGQIVVGMPMDAVYIAWGKPSEIVTGDPSQGVTAMWFYYAAQPQEQNFWADYDRWHDSGYYAAPYAMHDPHPHRYLRAEVKFAGDVVKEWSNLSERGH